MHLLIKTIWCNDHSVFILSLWLADPPANVNLQHFFQRWQMWKCNPLCSFSRFKWNAFSIECTFDSRQSQLKKLLNLVVPWWVSADTLNPKGFDWIEKSCMHGNRAWGTTLDLYTVNTLAEETKSIILRSDNNSLLRCNIFYGKQAGLRRAILEIYSEFSSNFPLRTHK
jgi:hypothetical protein